MSAFKVEEKKSYFCYEYLDAFSKLEETCLPAYEHFYSTLKKCNVFQDDGQPESVGRQRYADMQQLWRDRGFTCLRDLLEYYNNGDVLGFVKALEQQRDFFREIQNLDMLKDAYTLPGLALAFVFNSTDKKFKLISEPKINRMIRDNVVGGPAIVFHRHVKVIETKIAHVINQETSS